MLKNETLVDPLDSRQLLDVLIAVRKGDFSARMPIDRTGLAGKVADTLNDIVQINADLVIELERLRKNVGREGHTDDRATLSHATGGWKAALTSLNELVADMARPTNEIARVIGSVASGDLRQTVALEVAGEPLRGDFLQTARTVNSMVQQLGTFASELTRVAREVGTDGKLGGQCVWGNCSSATGEARPQWHERVGERGKKRKSHHVDINNRPESIALLQKRTALKKKCGAREQHRVKFDF